MKRIIFVTLILLPIGSRNLTKVDIIRNAIFKIHKNLIYGRGLLGAMSLKEMMGEGNCGHYAYAASTLLSNFSTVGISIWGKSGEVHRILEIYLGDKWHALDPTLGVLYENSFLELLKNPDLATKNIPLISIKNQEMLKVYGPHLYSNVLKYDYNVDSNFKLAEYDTFKGADPLINFNDIKRITSIRFLQNEILEEGALKVTVVFFKNLKPVKELEVDITSTKPYHEIFLRRFITADQIRIESSNKKLKSVLVFGDFGYSLGAAGKNSKKFN